MDSTTIVSGILLPGVTSTADTPMNVGERNYFGWIDYLVFGGMLLISALIGIFFACRSRRRAHVSTDAYLMANRKMAYGPVAMSLIASFMSSVTILGVPAEFYVYGTMFTWFALVYAVMPIIVGWIYMPVFYDLGISSSYEYLEKRFNKGTRLVTTFMYIVLSILYGGIVVYGPALALHEATGFDMWIAILSTGLVCIFYTSLGGLKAVIWTDVFQSFVMISGFIAIIVQGSINLGGFGNVWKAAESEGRIDFAHFEFDPRIRLTFWSIMFGGLVLWLGINGVNQTQVQRYICCRTKRDAQWAIILNALGLIVILVLAGMTGLTIYATYKNCDLLDSNKVGKADQLFPFAVMDLLGDYPGIPGLFVAGIYSSSLSTISSAMNAMACVTLEDFIKPYTNMLSRTYTMISKLLVLVFGATFILFAYIASQWGGLIQMAFSVHGIVNGPVVGLFTLGMLLPFVNGWGAFAGVLCGWGTTIWMFVGSILYPRPKEFANILPRVTEGCTPNQFTLDEGGNQTQSMPGFESSTSLSSATLTYFGVNSTKAETNDRPIIAEFYALSYFYLAAVGCTITLLIGILVSVATGMTRKAPPSDDLLTPLFYKRQKKIHTNTLERSSSWFSPSHIANAQRVSIRNTSASSHLEFEPLHSSPDVIASLNGDTFVPDKESSF